MNIKKKNGPDQYTHIHTHIYVSRIYSIFGPEAECKYHSNTYWFLSSARDVFSAPPMIA